jgi:glycosyltransferase involved in cell wall biosynthesis
MPASSTKRPPGLSVVFPACNDGATIASLVIAACQAAQRLTPDYEIIIVNDGSADRTPEIADELARAYPEVRVVHHPGKRGYGSALRSGFVSARKELIFYTDADGQYDPSELEALWPCMTDSIDLVTGYKITRSDPHHLVILGRLYHHMVSLLFGFRVRDVDCDFRLVRKSVFDRIELHRNSGVICLEMIKKIQDADCGVVEVPVHHYHRTSGRSQFFNFGRLARTAVDVARLWVELVVLGRHRAQPEDLGFRFRWPVRGETKPEVVDRP